MGAGMQAVSALGSVWQGPAATAATGKGVQAATAGGLVAEQGAEISTSVAEAAAVVGEGEVELQAVIDSFMSVVAAVGPALWLPPGQATVVAAAEEHLDHALEVVSRVKAQLSQLSGQVGVAGRKVPIANPPMSAAISAAQAAASVGTAVASASTQLVSGLGKTVTEGVSSGVKTAVGAAAAAGKALTGTSGQEVAESAAGERVSSGPSMVSPASGGLAGYPSSELGGARPGLGTGSGSVGSGIGSGIGAAGLVAARAGVGVPAPTLVPSPPAAQPAPRAVVEGGARTLPADASEARRAAGGMLPLGGAGARPAQAGDHSAPDYLVTTANGEGLVGALPPAGPQVLGDAEPVETQGPSMDIELRL